MPLTNNEATSIRDLISSRTIFEPASVAVIVKTNEPADVGVPDRTPVVGFSVMPVGNAPVVTANVYGGTPPVAAMVAE